MLDVPGRLVDELAPPVGAVMRALLELIPPGPAARLGRWGVPGEARQQRRPAVVRVDHDRVALPPPHHPVVVKGESTALHGLRRLGTLNPRQLPAASPHRDPASTEPVVLAALRELGPLVAERLLGALELTVTGTQPPDVPGLVAYLPPPPADGRYGFASLGQESETLTAALLVERLRPGLADLVLALARRLAAHPSIVPLMAETSTAGDEAAIAARHGRAHLALTVAAAHAVVGQLQVPPAVDRAALIVGVGLGAAAVVLGETPMPAAYAAARREKIRAEYLLPRRSFGSVRVSGHRFALAEGAFPDSVDVTGNGLVTVVDGGAVIRTGRADGAVRVHLTVLAEAPSEVASGWEEIVEVSWRAAEGLASVLGPDGTSEPQLRAETPPWPGDYRLRVHARGRDEADDPDAETYELVVWSAPAGPEVVHRRTDRLGHRLRGEPEPVRAPRPEQAYRWVRRSSLSEAATVTVTTGATVEEVLRAFGADPKRPEPIPSIEEDLFAGDSNFPWVTVLDTGPAILAVEFNGFRGSRGPVLRRASAGGRSASMFWNVRALTRLSFAEHGRLLAAFEPGTGGDLEAMIAAEPAVAAALAGLDLDDHVDRGQKGLVAVERFTGYGITAADLDRITAAGIGFRIVAD
ncbi:hypothetical protein E1211_00560 [Micromonospora sp. 15K316]|uniref:DUF6461 domain-containing protein n=1 Tax=Micromonospora sp. 15K316 TaxID=2530376 RepID=UPI001045FFC7|nr:DUF6461 domain-containing protein [Micromonospora sp. 15K316]TDC40636.1 hypothetical protein E1211_00560 [Micromonospora sp. 15K316]